MTIIQDIIAVILGILSIVSISLGIWKEIKIQQGDDTTVKDLAQESISSKEGDRKLGLGIQALERGDLDNAYHFLMMALDAYGKARDEPNMDITRDYLAQVRQERAQSRQPYRPILLSVTDTGKTQPIERVGS